MRILIDTAVLIYAVEAPERLSKKVAAVLQNPENVLELSAVSLVEIAIKTSLGKLELSAAMARQAVEDLDILRTVDTPEEVLHWVQDSRMRNGAQSAILP